MGGANVPERLDLVTAGSAVTQAKWGGGKGVVVVHVAGSISAGVLQMLVDGVWVPCKDINGSAITFTGAIGMFNFELPETFLRMSGTLTGSSVLACGI